MLHTNFLALDLELNKPEGTDDVGKIIQVGIVIGNQSSFNSKINYFEKSWYVNPYEKIYTRITELTGITDDNVLNESTSLEDIQEEISNLMSHYECFPNPVVWGGGDAYVFKKEVKENVGFCKVFGYREIDVKTIYTFLKIAQNHNTKSSLKSALNSYKLEFDGIQHRAMDDARNTLNLFYTLLNKQNNFHY